MDREAIAHNKHQEFHNLGAVKPRRKSGKQAKGLIQGDRGIQLGNRNILGGALIAREQLKEWTSLRLALTR